ncbi:MAG TPA: hypothetical protein VIA62_01210 [Thermoanaerobaculia bacterium]|jgi:hypothetical protein|nr:hypothetical protein [Thermoanaerobaculia bacterium]
MPRTRTGDTVGGWSALAERVTPETTQGSPLLERTHAELQGFVDEIQDLLVQRDFYEARKQETTQRINEILPAGRRTATLLRRALRQHLGPDNEQLAAFGIQPFRGRKRSRKASAASSPAEGDGEPST